METKKPIYLVGYYSESGNFVPCDYRTYNVLADSEDEANKLLKKARETGWAESSYQIYRVTSDGMKPVIENTGLKEFTILKKLSNDELETNALTWFSEEIPAVGEIYIHGWWKYSPAKRMAVYEYEYRIGRMSCLMGTEGVERLHKIEDQIAEDLKNQCLYRLSPIIKRIMKEKNLTNIRVEFRNKYTGGKIVRGFIENKGV